MYLIFIALELSDSLFRASWSVMHNQLEVSFFSAGLVIMKVSIGTIVSSLHHI